MSIKKSAGLQTSGTTVESNDEPRIESPTPEFDNHGDYTSDDSFPCTSDDIDAMRRRALRDGGCKCNGGWS